MTTPNERDDAIRLANKLLDEPNADPDDNERMLSRQFLRALEIVDRQEKALKEVDWEGVGMNDLIQANRDAILKIHQEAMRLIGLQLIGGGSDSDYQKLVRIGQIVHAANVFHPMHSESWCGWSDTTKLPEATR